MSVDTAGSTILPPDLQAAHITRLSRAMRRTRSQRRIGVLTVAGVSVAALAGAALMVDRDPQSMDPRAPAIVWCHTAVTNDLANPALGFGIAVPDPASQDGDRPVQQDAIDICGWRLQELGAIAVGTQTPETTVCLTTDLIVHVLPTANREACAAVGLHPKG